jgi:hypothetical protein
MAEEVVGAMRVLSRMNGWQRLWFVLTALAFIGVGIVYSFLEAYRVSPIEIEYRNSLMQDFSSGKCSDYLSKPIKQLSEPDSNIVGGCWHIYVSRTFDKVDTTPYSIEVHDQKEASRRNSNFVTGIMLYGGLTLGCSLLVYFAGFLTAWIRRGFAQTA